MVGLFILLVLLIGSLMLCLKHEWQGTAVMFGFLTFFTAVALIRALAQGGS